MWCVAAATATARQLGRPDRGGARLPDPNGLGRHRAALGGRAQPWTQRRSRGRLLHAAMHAARGAPWHLLGTYFR